MQFDREDLCVSVYVCAHMRVRGCVFLPGAEAIGRLRGKDRK